MIARFYEWLWGFPPESIADCFGFVIISGILIGLAIFSLAYFWFEILPNYRDKK